MRVFWLENMAFQINVFHHVLGNICERLDIPTEENIFDSWEIFHFWLCKWAFAKISFHIIAKKILFTISSIFITHAYHIDYRNKLYYLHGEIKPINSPLENRNNNTDTYITHTGLLSLFMSHTCGAPNWINTENHH